jgi:hypothetical protein
MRGAAPRVAEHYRLLGILTTVYSGLVAFTGLCILIVSRVVLEFILANAHGSTPPPAFIGPFISFIGWIILAKGVLGLAAGIGLINRSPWARTLTLIFGFLSLINIPLGTALGIYAIWVLLSTNAEKDYEQLSYAAR